MRVDVFDWTENSLTEQSITFGFLSTIVDRLWFCNFTVAPLQNIFGASNSEAYRVEISDTTIGDNS